ncbi:hypothetical protein OAK07_01900 [Marine Group III euryarchaeote]|nr:hypothetical protein [Marine Group III euryarchaeote]|tara:strand:+ start:829 stop:1125 length:297 start_codon:yes stop_codon:yes gene_type:complete
MAEKDSGTSFASMFVGTLGFTISIICILGFFVSGFAIDYIDDRIEEDCESEKGQVGQIVGADEGKCDEGSSIRDLLALIRYPLLIVGIVFALLALQVF